MVENLFVKKNPLQDLLSSLNAVISTNERQSCSWSQDQGGFQLLDLIITELKSHMTCYNSMPLIG